MSEHQRDRIDDTTHVVGLLDRAAAHTPPLHVEHDQVVARGRRIRGGRRRTAAGVGALALAGTLWLGMETLPFGGEASPAPASVGWSDGSIDVELFDNGPNPEHEPGRPQWSGRLRTVEGGQHPELTLTRAGGEPVTILGEDGPGESEVFRADGITVLVWPEPDDGLSQEVLWTDGVAFGQGGVVEVPGGRLRYATSEHVGLADPDVVELYLFDQDGVRAASGAPVESTVLQTDDMTWVVGLDTARQVWLGSNQVAEGAGWGQQLRLVEGAAYTGGLGDTPSFALGVLPQGATAVAVAPQEARSDLATVAGHELVLATADQGADLPTVHFALDGQERELSSFVEAAEREVVLGGSTLGYQAMPEGLQLQDGGSVLALTPADLEDGSASVAAVADRTLIVVPGWAPSDGAARLRVAVAGAAEGDTSTPTRVEVQGEDLQVRELFDGRPVTLLAIDALADGERVVGVGETVAGGDVADVTDLDLDQIEVRSFED